MNNLFDEFWHWLGITPERYADVGVEQIDGSEECDFPRFCELIAYAEEIVNGNLLSESYIDELLTVMAIDNESEHMLDYIEKNSSDEQFEKIIHLGMVHLQPEARWQLAELIYRRKPKNYIEYLLKLSQDPHNYVRKRAQNCIEYLRKS